MFQKKFLQIPNLLYGFSTIDFGNVSSVHDKKNEVLKNRARFARAIGVDSQNLISICQEHGKKILVLDSGSSFNRTETMTADGLITNQKMLV